MTSALPRGGTLLCPNCHVQFSAAGGPVQAQTSQLALASLVLGLLSFICFLSTAVPAIIVGLAALHDLRGPGSKGKRRGAWMAVAGIASSLASLLLITAGLAFLFQGNLWQQVTQLQNANKIYQQQVSKEAIVGRQDSWKWLHPLDGTDPEESVPGFHTSFYELDFDDSQWQTAGPEAFDQGMGYGDEVAMDIGTPPEGDRLTAYFRCVFETTRPYEQLELWLFRDDGMVVFLDGQEVIRNNVESGAVNYYLAAIDTISNEGEQTRVQIPFGLPRLEPGRHVLAISLHNRGDDSSDLRIGQIELRGQPIGP
ncbi:MAG: DUF4190 domain-containing protein [Planctomycetales bacterium]|nr:DUF4190 domain-containing protein [Planctomycetales bacterium]